MLISGDFPQLELENITVNPAEKGYIVDFTAYVYGKTDGAANVVEVQRRLEQVVRGLVTLRVRVVPSELEVIDSAGPQIRLHHVITLG